MIILQTNKEKQQYFSWEREHGIIFSYTEELQMSNSYFSQEKIYWGLEPDNSSSILGDVPAEIISPMCEGY